MYVARRTWAFDGIFWKYLDEKFFGKNESSDFKERLKLLSLEQVDAMKELVKRKLEEKEECAESKLPPNI
ncbi:hypothetical protein QQZ08_000100 [Neonectria magnoliae]|uniref:Uncharacterized protein n=1 Tax=Neonectria magnoliae TaxID=2732573 RepID=A0ABR1IIQ1_9HYPO